MNSLNYANLQKLDNGDILMPDNLIFNTISFKWYDMQRREVSPPPPIEAYVEGFTTMGVLSIRFNQGLNPDLLTEKVLMNITNFVFVPF